MWLRACVLLAVAVASTTVAASACACEGVGDDLLLACGTDAQTHLLGPDSVSCLYHCGVGIRYAGMCGCPNDCGAGFARGLCMRNSSTCQCWSSWQGSDCNTPSAPTNQCHSRGTAQWAPATGASYCSCGAGFTGRTCLAAVPVSALPYGYLTSRTPCATDPFCASAHPTFNLSSVAVLHLHMSPQALVYLLAPANRLNGTYVNAVNVTFVQSGAVAAFGSGEVKVGGSYSKSFAKVRCWWCVSVSAGACSSLTRVRAQKGFLVK